MGRKKPTQRVTQYFTSLQYGICHGIVEKFISLRINDKIVGECSKVPFPVFFVNRPDLFGGLTKEGGITGRITLQNGSADQLTDAFVASKKGRTPTTMNGYRGIATAWFTEAEGGYVAGSTPGESGWIGADFIRFLIGQFTSPYTLSGSMKGFYWGANQPFIPPVHFRLTRIDRSWRPDIAAISGEIDVAETAICIAIDLSTSMSGSRIDAAKLAAKAVINDLRENDNAATFDIRIVGWSSSTVAIERRECTPEDYDDLIAFIDGMVLTGGTVFTNAVDGLADFYDGSGGKCRVFVFLTDGAPNDVDDATEAGEILAATGAEAFAFNLVLADTSQTAKMDNTPYDGVPVITLANAERTLSNFFRSAVTQQIDMNPAHIIRECLVNSVWGLGLPESMLNNAMFEAAAQTLYDERFGLSMIWTRQDTIETFVSEVLDHIRAAFFFDPASGLICLKLLRDDYDRNTLPILTPSNCVVKTFKRRSPAEVTNEIVVTWTNPTSEKEEVVTMQSLGSIVANSGEVVQDNRNYYGVTRASLAAELCARDLAEATAPLATAEVEADRSFSRVVPGDVLKLTDPENGANEIIMRVMKVNYGRPGASKIALSLTEDIFSYAKPRAVLPPVSQNTSRPRLPTTPENVEGMTVNYYMNINSQDGVDDMVDPDAQVAFFVSTTNSDTFDMEVREESLLPTGESEFTPIGDFNLTGRTTLSATLPAQITSDITFSNVTVGVQPAVGSFAIIGSNSIPENEHEIALISEALEGGGGWRLTRGVLDTVPREWLPGTPVRFFSGGSKLIDASVNTSGVEQEYRFLTRTSRALLSESRAGVLNFIPSDRFYAPYRPANVVVAGASFGEVDARSLTTIEVSWANRNRLTEEVVVLGWNEPTVTPETGQTTTIRLINDLTGAVITQYTDLTGTSHSFPATDRGSADFVRVIVIAVRDGYESIQGHEVLLAFAPLPYSAISHGSWLNATESTSVFEDMDMLVSAATDLDPLAVITNQKGSL